MAQAKPARRENHTLLGHTIAHVLCCQGARRGHTLVEVTICMLVLGVLTSFGVPRFTRALEQSRVDIAAANLRAVWTAERLYWLKHQSFASASDLSSLISDPNLDSTPPDNFLDPHVNSANSVYVCSVTDATATTFTASATRSGSAGWSSTLAIDQNGTVTGSVTDPSGNVFRPSQSFQ